jgi:hypothetical protein
MDAGWARHVARRRVRVHYRYKLCARLGGQNSRVMLAEVPDADDGDAQRHYCCHLLKLTTKTRRHEERTK